MTYEGGFRAHRPRVLLWVLLVLVLGTATSPARAGGDRILNLAKNAIYGGATGLLVGGVLTLVVDHDKRDDVVRWGVVIGTFAGLGYGFWEMHNDTDGFTELVQARSEARSRSRQTAITTAPAPWAAPEAAGTPFRFARASGASSDHEDAYRRSGSTSQPRSVRAIGREAW